MVSHRSLSDIESLEVFRILTDFNYAVFWLVSIPPLIFKSFGPSVNPLVTVPRAQITVGITATLMFHIFVQFFFCGQLGQQIPEFGTFSFSSLLFLGLVIWPRFADPFVSQNLRGVCAFLSPRRILGCAYTICSYAQISISCTITSESPYPSSCVWSYIPFAQNSSTCLLWDWSFRLYHHIIYICCFFASYLFLVWYDWSFCRWFVLLLEDNLQ